MIPLEKEVFRKLFPYALESNIEKFFQPLNDAMEEFAITTSARIAAFCAQIEHESGSLRYTEEIASGEAYDTGKKALSLGNTSEKDGDGQKYKGRGLLQITGKANYEAASKALGESFVKNPTKLALPEAAARSAAWFWQSHHLNELADKGDFVKITKVINGGTNGFEHRLDNYRRNCELLGVDCEL